MRNNEVERIFSRKMDKILAWGVVVIVIAVIVRWLMFFM